MKGSLSLGKYAGIRVDIHWTFLLLILWIVFLELTRGSDLTAILWSTFFILVLFVCVVLHEFGHALTARKFNIGTRQITLLPIGGVASLEDMPENPMEEFLVAIAGPAVNVVIAFALFLVVPVEQYVDMDTESLEQTMSAINSENFLFYLFSANIMLVLFNMLPAFPMDGGRVFRALLSMKMNRVVATRMAARLGQGVAFFFFFIGLFYNPILILIAIFIYFGAQGESVMVQQLSLLKNYKVRDAMMTDITTLHPEDTLDDVVDIILTGTERDFIVRENGEVRGILNQSDLIQAFKARDNRDIRVKEIMDKTFIPVKADDDLADLYRKMRSNNKSYFPVVDNNKLVGAVDMNNLNEFMIFRAPQGF